MSVLIALLLVVIVVELFLVIAVLATIGSHTKAIKEALDQ